MIKFRRLSRHLAIQSVYLASISEKSYFEAFDNILELVNITKEEMKSIGFENIFIPELFNVLGNDSDSINEIQLYAQKLIEGVSENKDILFDFLSKNDKSRTPDRLDYPVLSILLVSMFEILNGEFDFKIAINEALELCKIYSNEESKNYVNSVLQAYLEN